MEKATYRLYDVYEDAEKLIVTNSLEEVKKTCRKREKETDSEWMPKLYKLDKYTNKYEVFEDWSY